MISREFKYTGYVFSLSAVKHVSVKSFNKSKVDIYLMFSLFGVLWKTTHESINNHHKTSYLQSCKSTEIPLCACFQFLKMPCNLLTLIAKLVWWVWYTVNDFCKKRLLWRNKKCNQSTTCEVKSIFIIFKRR